MASSSEGGEPPPSNEPDSLSLSTSSSADSLSLSYKLKAGAFLVFTGGFGMCAGFAGALGQAKKQDPSSFDKGMTGLDPQAGRNICKAKIAEKLNILSIYAPNGT